MFNPQGRACFPSTGQAPFICSRLASWPIPWMFSASGCIRGELICRCFLRPPTTLGLYMILSLYRRLRPWIAVAYSAPVVAATAVSFVGAVPTWACSRVLGRYRCGLVTSPNLAGPRMQLVPDDLFVTLRLVPNRMWKLYASPSVSVMGWHRRI